MIITLIIAAVIIYLLIGMIYAFTTVSSFLPTRNQFNHNSLPNYANIIITIIIILFWPITFLALMGYRAYNILQWWLIQ